MGVSRGVLDPAPAGPRQDAGGVFAQSGKKEARAVASALYPRVARLML